MGIQEEFDAIEKRHKGFVKQFLGGKQKAESEKLLAIALHLQGVEGAVSSSRLKTEEDFAAIAKQVGDQTQFLRASMSGLKDAEAQLKDATDKEFEELESLLAKASEALGSSQKRSHTELAGKLDDSAAKLREALESTREALKQGNKEVAISVAQVGASVSQVSSSVSGVSKSLSQLGEKLAIVQSSLMDSMIATEKSVEQVQDSVEDSFDKTSKRVENIAAFAQALGSALSEFRVENRGQAKVLDDVNKQIVRIQTETVKLESDLKQTGEKLGGSLVTLAGQVSSAKEEIEVVGSEMKEAKRDLSAVESEVANVEAVVKKLPTEASISKKVRQEFARKLLEGDEKEDAS